MWEDPEYIPEVGMSELTIYNKDGVLTAMTKGYKLKKFESKLEEQNKDKKN